MISIVCMKNGLFKDICLERVEQTELAPHEDRLF
jgi:hypothetical protein